MAQMANCLSTMRETWVRSLGWEDSLEREMATHSSTLPLKIPWMEELGAGYCPWGRKESGTTERLHFHFLYGRLVTKKWPQFSLFLLKFTTLGNETLQPIPWRESLSPLLEFGLLVTCFNQQNAAK